MKRLWMIPFVLLLALSACAGPEPSPDATPAITPTATVAPAVTPVPQPSETDVRTDIPAVEPAAADTAVNSGRTLVEDANSVYYLSPWYDEAGVSRNGLYRIGRTDGSAVLIAQDVSCLALYEGKVCYATGEMVEYNIVYNTVYRYDPVSGSVAQLFQCDKNIYKLAVYEAQIYYSADPEPESDQTFDSSLYRCGMDGGDEVLLAENAHIFGIEGDQIFFTSGSLGDGTPVFACSLDGTNAREIVPWTYWENFEVHGGTLYYIGEGDSLTLYDISSGAQTPLSGYYNFALLGQYVVAQGDALDAYDTRTGEIYRLLDMDAYWEDGWTYLHTGDGDVYLSAESDDGAFVLYRLVIEDGRASLAPIAHAEP